MRLTKSSTYRGLSGTAKLSLSFQATLLSKHILQATILSYPILRANGQNVVLRRYTFAVYDTCLVKVGIPSSANTVF